MSEVRGLLLSESRLHKATLSTFFMQLGKSTGHLMEGSMFLARSVILVDKKGVVRYIQVVPDITHLPDMERAFQKAMEVSKQGT